MNKTVIFSFNGNPICFGHVLLNALDMNEKNMEAKIVVEGESVKLIRDMEEAANPLYLKAKEQGLIDGICKACSAKMGVLDYNQGTGIPLLDSMKGHPPLADYIKAGYTVVTM